MTLATAAGAPVIVTPHDVTVSLIPYDASGGDDEVGTATVTSIPSGELTVEYRYTVPDAGVAEVCGLLLASGGLTVWRLAWLLAAALSRSAATHTRMLLLLRPVKSAVWS